MITIVGSAITKPKLMSWLVTAALGTIVIVAALLLTGIWNAQATGLGQAEDQKGGSGSPLPDSPLTGAAVPVVQEGFEQNDLLYTQLIQTSPTCVPGGCGWAIVNTDHHSGAYSVHGPDVAGKSDQQLILNSPAVIPANATTALLAWWQRYDFDHLTGHYYDGGVLELSTDGGTSWTDAAGLFTQGGYPVTLDSGTANPLTGRQAWGGTSAGWVAAQVNLMGYRGESLLFRFRLGTDAGNAQPNPGGWWVDDLVLIYQGDAVCDPWGWTVAQPYPSPIAYSAVVKGYGGIDSYGGLNGLVNDAAYEYSTSSWGDHSSLPSPRTNAAAAGEGAYDFILGGKDSSFNPTNTFYAYHPAFGWSPRPPMSLSVYDAGAAFLNDYVYRVGGRDAGGNYLASVEAYSMDSGTWAPRASMPQGSAQMALAAIGDYLYVAGGLTSSGLPTAKTYRYDPTTNTWDDAAITDLPGSRAGMAAAVYNGVWLLAGGTGNGANSLASVLAWDPATNQWSSRAHLPAPVAGAQAASDGSIFITVGGLDAQGNITNVVYSYSDSICPAPTACPVQFTDVGESNTFYPYVRCLACRNIVSGYNTAPPCAVAPCFLPGNNVTRGQTAKFVSNAANYTDAIPTNRQTFTDVPYGSPFWLYVERAYLHGVVSGYNASPPCTTGTPCFLPGNNVTRGQTAKFVSNAIPYNDAIPISRQTFTDVPHANPFWLYIERAYSHGVINGYNTSPPCTTGTPCFQVANNVTRGQTAKFISNSFFPGCSTPLR